MREGREVEGAFAQFPDASSAQDESARRLFLQPLSLAGETSCEAFPHLLSAGPSVDGSAGGLADRGISLSLLERRAIWLGMRSEERRVGQECVATGRYRWCWYN